eukprot:1447300-Amphidinium_carterae.1
MQARNSQLTHELTQANLRVLQHEEASQNPHPPITGQEGEPDAALRTELATMSEHLTEARRIRVTQAHDAYQRVTNLERTEAGLREAEIMVSRERDSYFEELVTQVQQSSIIPVHPTAVAVHTPAPGYTAPAPSSVLATATLPNTTHPP